MALDVVGAHRLGDSRLLIKIEHVTVEVWIVDDAAKVALEMAVIDDVEPDKRAEKTPVGFDDSVAEQVATVR